MNHRSLYKSIMLQLQFDKLTIANLWVFHLHKEYTVINKINTHIQSVLVISELCKLMSSKHITKKWGRDKLGDWDWLIHIVVVVQALSRVWLFCNPMDYSLLGSSVHGTFQARILEWVDTSLPEDLPGSVVQPASPTFAGGLFTPEPPGNTHYNI